MTNGRGEPRRQHAAGGALLGDILDGNMDPRAERQAVRDWVRRAVRSAKLRDLADGDASDALFRRHSRTRTDHDARRHVSGARRRHVLRIIT